MPYISTKTNIELAKDKRDALAAKYGEIISIVPGKTERWLMLSFDGGAEMYFGGRGDEPMAYIELTFSEERPTPSMTSLRRPSATRCPRRPE